ncbi:MAG: membrane protein insertion efficiency factor YidD [Candidatus Dadabacteria bacterium]|nr:membrane protein insertion efficiency factor YidD [Candidatus Dadabacteria bacterium]NIQ17050.1 membrane protein insertion efficiency factor YidD [Candidatus Dadabacteria bacterium]
MFQKSLQYSLIKLIKAYKYCISPFLHSNCRFHPSCSSYAIDALNQYGITKGLFLALKRISKCHPFNKGGYDPVNK